MRKLLPLALVVLALGVIAVELDRNRILSTRGAILRPENVLNGLLAGRATSVHVHVQLATTGAVLRLIVDVKATGRDNVKIEVVS